MLPSLLFSIASEISSTRSAFKFHPVLLEKIKDFIYLLFLDVANGRLNYQMLVNEKQDEKL